MTSSSVARAAFIAACIAAFHSPGAHAVPEKKTANRHVERAEVPEVFTGAPKLTLEEMKYRVDLPADVGGGTVLKPLTLAPKVGVRFRFDPETLDEQYRQDWNLAFARSHGAEIIPSPYGFPARTHLVLALSVVKPDEIVSRLNALLADPNVLDILPVFYVENREAIATGVEVEFSVPFGERQLLQMLYAYGEVTDLAVTQRNTSGKWTIAPKERLFTLPARIAERDGRRTVERRFDLNVLLLANLFEGERIAKEVPVRRARPVFEFLEPPVLASLAVRWGSSSIGNLRELRLTVMILDEARVVFDPKRIPELGTERLIPRRGQTPVRPGWFKFADPSGMPSKKSFGWKGDGRSTRTVGGRSVTVYEFTQSFYLLEPEESWGIGPLVIPYQLKSADAPKPLELLAEAPAIAFYVFAHTAKEGEITMPPPPSYAFPDDAATFAAPPAPVAPKPNAHAFAPYVGRWGEGAVAATAAGALLSALLLLALSVVGARSAYRKTVEARPKPVAYPTEADFNRMCAALAAAPDAPADKLADALRNARRIAEELLARRVDGIAHGAVTTVELKDVARTRPAYRDAMQEALALFRAFDVLDAPSEMADAALLRDALEEARVRLATLYAALAALPPLMTKGVPDGHSAPRHA